MSLIRLKIDIGGTIGSEAWHTIRHFDMVQKASFGPDYGGTIPCLHSANQPHPAGEWWGAVVTVPNNLVAQYAVAHYLEQERVLDADIE